ncbi:hypothetical protein Tco_0746792 [Tanacetum coccineum]
MIGKSFNVKDCKVTLMDGQRIMLDFTSMEGYDSTNIFDAERHLEKDVASPMSAPVPDARDLNFESNVTGSCSEENNKSLSKTDTYCEGLDKVGLNSFGPANMDSKIIKSDTTIKD